MIHTNSSDRVGAGDRFLTDAVDENMPERAPARLLGRLGLLGVISGCVYLIPTNFIDPDSWLAGVIMLALGLIALVYLAWVSLRTRDMVANPDMLHPLDAWFCKYSGPLSVLLVLGILVFFLLSITAAESANEPPIWMRSPLAAQALYFSFEVEFVLSVACFCSSRRFHVRPLLMWKCVATLQMIVFGMYVVFVPFVLVIGFLRDW